VTISEHVILFVLFIVFPPALTYFAQPDLFLACLILFPAIYVVMHIGMYFQARKGEEIDAKWKEVADRFQLRFNSESSSERTIHGELDGSHFRIQTSYERGGGGDGSGFDVTTYRIQPRNIDNILTAGSRDIDHYAVNKRLDNESIREVLGRVKNTAGCTLQYVDGWVVWSELYIARTEQLLTPRVEQMFAITELLLDQGSAS